jgi:hypothetical protein
MGCVQEGDIHFFYVEELPEEEQAEVFRQAVEAPADLARKGHAVVASSAGPTYVMPPELFLRIRGRLGELREAHPDSVIVIPETRLDKNTVWVQVEYAEVGSGSDSDSDDANWVARTELYSFGGFCATNAVVFKGISPAAYDSHVGRRMRNVGILIGDDAVTVAGAEINTRGV